MVKNDLAAAPTSDHSFPGNHMRLFLVCASALHHALQEVRVDRIVRQSTAPRHEGARPQSATAAFA